MLKGIDLTVREGEAIAILCANGAGKTTPARAIAGAIAPTGGVLRIAGNDIKGLASHQIAALGVAHCMEGRRIFPTLSVEENLKVAARDANAATIRSRLDAIYGLFPALAERTRDSRHVHVWRTAADAGDRTRADGPAAACHFR